MPVYAAMRHALLVVRGGPESPTVDRSLTGHDLECVATHPEEPNRVFCGTFGAGLWRSTDGGTSFDRVGENLPDAVMAVTCTPTDPDELWAGTEPSRVYRSTDGGVTWESVPGLTDLPSAETWSFPPRPQTHHVRWIEVDPDDPAHLYVSIEAGALVQTHDRGETWVDRRPGSRRDNHSLAIHPEAPETVRAAAGDGYAESTDDGETWLTPVSGLDHRYCWSVAIDPGDPGTVLVSSARGPGSAHRAGSAESYLYRRRDGSDWTRVDDAGIPTGEGVLRSVLAAGQDDGECYALNNRGLYRTTTFGEDWDRLPLDWDDAFETQTARGLSVVP